MQDSITPTLCLKVQVGFILRFLALYLRSLLLRRVQPTTMLDTILHRIDGSWRCVNECTGRLVWRRILCKRCFCTNIVDTNHSVVRVQLCVYICSCLPLRVFMQACVPVYTPMYVPVTASLPFLSLAFQRDVLCEVFVRDLFTCTYT